MVGISEKIYWGIPFYCWCLWATFYFPVGGTVALVQKFFVSVPVRARRAGEGWGSRNLTGSITPMPVEKVRGRSNPEGESHAPIWTLWPFLALIPERVGFTLGYGWNPVPAGVRGWPGWTLYLMQGWEAMAQSCSCQPTTAGFTCDFCPRAELYGSYESVPADWNLTFPPRALLFLLFGQVCLQWGCSVHRTPWASLSSPIHTSPRPVAHLEHAPSISLLPVVSGQLGLFCARELISDCTLLGKLVCQCQCHHLSGNCLALSLMTDIWKEDYLGLFSGCWNKITQTGDLQATDLVVTFPELGEPRCGRPDGQVLVGAGRHP